MACPRPYAFAGPRPGTEASCDGAGRDDHGCQPGIGAATALVLAERGYRVGVNYRASAPQAEGVVATIAAAGGEAVAIQADVTVPDDVTAMVGEIDRRWRGGRARAQRADAVCCHLVRRAELGAARRQAGQRAAGRVPDNEGRCAGNGFAWLRAADLSQYGAVAASA